jgi:pyruvate kinase
MRHTKIIATVGPASDADDILDAMIAAGADIFRLNFSHGTHDTQAASFSRVRAAAKRARREVAILQDLGGPKIRTGPTRSGQPIPVKRGEELVIATGDFPSEPGRISTTFAGLARSVRPGDRLLLADGSVELRVESTDSAEIRTTVVEGEEIGAHKGINAPGIALPASAITPKDVDDLKFGLSLGVDMVALSFVQTAEDVRQARGLLAQSNAADVPLIAKIERPLALDHLDEILAACDAVMVARGDLGLEMPLERVPRVQKEVTRKARARAIPVIVATQVLESMRTEPRPTRAEVSDAANAVDDGVDAIMLAGETAAGKFPLRAVQTLDLIIRDAEQMPPVLSAALGDTRLMPGPGRALCEAAVTLAGHSDAAAIVAVTRGGKTARVLSALRPRAPIYAATGSAEIARQLTLAWGVVPLVCDLGTDVSQAIARISETLVERAFVAPSSVIVVVSISPDLAQGPSNFLKLQRI